MFFKICYPIHNVMLPNIYIVLPNIYTQYICRCHPRHNTPIDTCDTYILLSNTYGVFLRFLPKYMLGTRNIYWAYILGNTPYMLGNTSLYVLGNTNVTQDIYPIYIVCNPIYIDVIKHIYPTHIFIYIGVHIVYVLGNKNVTQDIYPIYSM